MDYEIIIPGVSLPDDLEQKVHDLQAEVARLQAERDAVLHEARVQNRETDVLLAARRDEIFALQERLRHALVPCGCDHGVVYAKTRSAHFAAQQGIKCPQCTGSPVPGYVSADQEPT
jgi:hypothetical protein